MDEFDRFYHLDRRPRIRGLVYRWLVIALALAVSAWIVKGIEIHGVLSLFVAALMIGILNAFVRPLVLILTLPLNILTMGLFTFVINALMIIMAAKVVRGFTVTDFWSALVGAIFLSIISFLINLFVSDEGTLEVIPPRWR